MKSNTPPMPGWAGVWPALVLTLCFPSLSWSQFVLNQRVQTTGASNVLSAPGGAPTGTQLPGGTGSIAGGPSSFSGTTYWNVAFDTAPSGWVAGSSLTSLPTLNILPNRWINVQPSYTGAPSGGQIYPQGWGNKQAYDPITHRILVSDRWYDPIRGVSIFANGIHAYDPFSNVFTVLKLNNWFVQTVTCSNGMTGCYQTTPLPANTADPTPPDAHPLGGYDFVPELNALYSVNGVNSVSLPDPSILNRTWKLDLTTRTWTVVSSDITAAVHPPNNGGSPSGLVYDKTSRKLVYQVPNACGCSGTTTYLFDPQTNLWTQAPQHSSSLGVFIAGAGLAYDSARGRVLAFGGNNFITSAATSQLWAYSVAQNVWTRLADAPVAAMAPAFAYDSRHDRFLALVGNNTYLYDPNANSWSQYPATLLRPAVLQTWQAATYDTAYDVFVFQGGTPDAPIFSLFRYDPAVAPPVTIDTHAPSISFVSPTHGSAVSGVVTVSVNATDTVIPGTTDAIGVVAVQYSLDGAKLGAPVSDPSGGYDLIWNTPAFTNGTHFLQATVFDSVGNTASATVSVVVSNGIPAPVISNVNAGSISASSAIISWTTTTASDSQVDYGLTAAYGITGGDGGALTTAHSVLLVGLTPATTYHFRAKSRDAQNALTVSDDFTFTTAAASGSQFLLHIQGDASETSGTSNGAVVTPVVRPAGWTGTLVVNGAGSVQFAPASSGNGVYFQNCCNNTGNAYYRFAGATVGSVFNVNQGHVSFYLKSRYSFAQRPAGARFAFDVRDNDPNNHIFYFQTLKTSGQLLLTYSVGGGAQFYYVPAGTEEAKFGSGVTMKVTLTWNGSQSQLFLNDVLVQTASYVKPVPNWTAASNFNLGAYEYAANGGYNSLDDIIDEFTVSGPAVGADTTPPAVSMTAPASGATVSGTGVTVSANATDNIAMGSVQFKLDGTNLGSAVTGAGPAYSTTWNTTTAANGAHTLTAVATDAAGNTATAVTINVTVNNVLVPPVISSVTANPVNPTSATITWTTDKPSDSRVSYGLTPALGTQTPLDTALVTSHSMAISGLTPATTYHYQVTSRDAQGTTAVSGSFTFLTPPAPSGSGTLLIRGDATELSGTTNGSVVTPYLAPSGFTGTLVAKGTGSVNYTPAQTGNGVYFQACCGNTNNAYYRFTGAAVGSVFNVNQGQISFYLKSRYSFAQRPSGARFAFDVRDNDPNNHLFFFHTLKASGQLLLTYSVGGGAQFYYVPAGTEEAKFGNGVTMKVTIAWTGSQSQLFLNDALVQTASYGKPTPNWTAASNFNLGAYEYLTFGGYNSLDDVIDEFSVSGAPAGSDLTPPAVSISAPANGAVVSGTAVTVSANATDNTAMASVQFKLDGTNLASAVTGAGPLYSAAWNTTTAANGVHTLTAIAADAAGNTTTSPPISVTVNNPLAPPVISSVAANPVSASSATITWTTDKPSDSRVSYGLTPSYGSLTPLDTALVTAHSMVISGLSPSTTYYYQVISKDQQGTTAVSAGSSFTTPAAPSGSAMLLIKADAAEVNGAIITPNQAPAGFTGAVVTKGSGTVNYTAAQVGNGVYFQNCCGNTNNAYYRFTGAAVGSVFNVNQGQISFYLKSRYSFAQRPSGARFAFDVRDNDPNNHLFFFHTLKASGQLLLTYSVGGGAQFYYVPAGTEEAKFGNGVTMKVTIAWTGSQSQLFLNDALVQTASYVKPTPNWTAASNFNLGAYEYLTFGGYNSLDDVIDEFTVSAPPGGQDTTPPAVSISAPTEGAALTGTGITVSANATDNTAMASVQFKLDGTNLGNAVTGAGPLYSITWNTTTAANGPHILTAIATDAAGNTAVSAPINVTVNNPQQPPVISGVSANPVTTATATITWTTDKLSDSRVAYGLTSAYGSLTPLDTAMVTSHSIVISGLSPSTTYHYQVISKDAQGLTGVSGNLTFTTGAASGGGGGTLLIKGDATEVSGTTNGSLVTPNVAPSGFTGTVVSKGSGTVNYAAAQTGNGVYFQNCCGNTNNAYYRFAGAAVGNVFNINQGQISFYLKSRYSFAQRPSGARFAFDVRDNDPNNHLFYFHTLKTSGQLLLTYSVGGGAQFYYIPAGTEEAKFGNGVAIKVTITWTGTQSQLYLNDVLVQTASYVKPTPNWTAASNFNLGAYEYLNLGGYNGLDDIIDEFTVSAPSN